MAAPLTDEMLVGYLHGALGEIERRQVEAAIADDFDVCDRLEGLAAQDEDIRQAFGAILSDPAPEHLIATVINTQPEAQVVDITAFREKKAARNWGWPQAGAIAASLAFGLFAGFQGSGLQPASGEAILVASAQGPVLSRVVQEFLGSAPSGERMALASMGTASVTISFKNSDGALCRQFAVDAKSGSTDGVACRDGGNWQLHALGLRPGETGELRTASGDAAPAVMAAVDALIDGEPLDEVAERNALKP